MRSKRFIGSIIIAAFVAIGGLVAITQPAAAYTGYPVFFFTPHQDDEALFLGASIKQHVAAGRQVWVVLLTDGGASSQCIPVYGTRAACVAARDQEFINGVTSLGATPIIRTDRVADGTLTAAYAKSVINNYYANVNYKLASYKTMSETDDHPDHAALGAGLRLSSPPDKRWCMKPADVVNHPKYTTAGKYNLNATLDMYPFGKISVPAYFTQATYPTGIFSRCYA